MSSTAGQRRSRPSLATRIEHAVDTRGVRFGAWLLRRTRGRAAHLWPRRALVLTTVGRRTGRPRTVVQFFPDRDDLVVVAANSGLPRPPAWYLNLAAHPRARVEVEEFWPRVLAAAPDYRRYVERAGHPLPLVRLRPLGA